MHECGDIVNETKLCWEKENKPNLFNLKRIINSLYWTRYFDKALAYIMILQGIW